MYIEFARTGGFAGLRLSASVDTQELPSEQVSAVEAMVRDADFFGLPEKLLPPAPSPDRFEYRVAISTDKKSHSIVANDALVPDRLRPLLDYLTTLAMTAKRGNQLH